MSSPGVEQAVRQPAVTGPEPPEDLPSDAETGKAIGLAAATMAANLVQVVFTVIFTRILGADGYGSLAALLNVTVILFVAGAALQVAAAREATLGRLGRGGELAGTLARWSRHILTALAAIAVVSVIAREPLADVINIDQEWAAAAVPITGALWLLLCLQRGLLQSARAYREVGLSVLFEALGRLVLAIALVAAGLDVTGAYLGTLTSIAVTAAALAWLLRRRLGPPDRASTAPPARRARPRRRAADRRADARRRAPERRRDHGQARARRQRRRRLRRFDGGRQGRGVDRRRPRLLGAAGGDPPRRRGARPARGAAEGARGDRRAVGGRAGDLRRSAGAAAADRVRRRVRVGRHRAAAARRRVRAAGGQLPVRAVPARPAPPRLRARSWRRWRSPSRCC